MQSKEEFREGPARRTGFYHLERVDVQLCTKKQIQEQLVEITGKVGTNRHKEEFLSHLGALHGKGRHSHGEDND